MKRDDGEDVYQTAAQLIHVHSSGSPSNVSMRSDVTGHLNADDVPNNLDRGIDQVMTIRQRRNRRLIPDNQSDRSRTDREASNRRGDSPCAVASANSGRSNLSNSIQTFGVPVPSSEPPIISNQPVLNLRDLQAPIMPPGRMLIDSSSKKSE